MIRPSGGKPATRFSFVVPASLVGSCPPPPNPVLLVNGYGFSRREAVVKFLIAPPLLLFSIALADSAVQADWSGGPGVPGPWGDWFDGFYDSQGCNFGTNLSLSRLGMLIQDDADAVWVETADIDSDGDRDVVTSCQPVGSEDGVAAWYENYDGLGGAWEYHVVSDSVTLSMNCTHPADLNGDGHPDLIVPVKYSNRIVAYLNSDGLGDTWIYVVVDGGTYRPEAISTADLNGDGDIDIVCCSRLGGTIGWWENANSAGTSWIPHTISSDFLGANYSQCIDMDEDGSIDIVTTGDWGGGVCWWDNSDGSGTTWTRRDVSPNLEGAFCARAGDIDLDGDLDLAGCSWTENSVYWWENQDGLGLQWVEHLLGNRVMWATSVFPADLDDDGDIDILSSGVEYGVSMWRNEDGFGGSWQETLVDIGYSPVERTFVDDLDDDGLMEGLGAGFSVNRGIKVWQLDQYESSAWLESTILYLGCDPAWGWIDWNAIIPSMTSVSFQVRASDDYTQMGSWSAVIVNPGDLAGVLADNSSYFQYRALLTTLDQAATPELEDVTISWDPLSVGQQQEASYRLIGPESNPSAPGSPVLVQAPCSSMISLQVFDISGREARAINGLVEAGVTYISMPALPSGIYFCRMQAGSFIATQRFAVVE